MKRIAKLLGTTAYWLGWPFYWVYFAIGQRTRVLIVHGDEVLVVSSWLSNGHWGLPGGGLHKHEDPAVGARREVQEEVGIVLPKTALKLLGTAPYRYHGYRYTYHQFVALVDHKPPIIRQWHEIAEARWMHYHELTKRNARPEVLTAIRSWRADTTRG